MVRKRRLHWLLTLLGLLASTPAWAGPITFEFFGTTLESQSFLGPQGTEIYGTVTFDLREVLDADSSAERDQFRGGQIFADSGGDDTGWVATFSVALFAGGEDQGVLVESASISLSSTAPGGQIGVSTRSSLSGNSRFSQRFSLMFTGAAALIDAYGGLDGSLPGAADILASIDPGALDIAQGSFGMSLDEVHFRIERFAMIAQSVSEPALSVLLLAGLLLLGRRRVC